MSFNIISLAAHQIYIYLNSLFNTSKNNMFNSSGGFIFGLKTWLSPYIIDYIILLKNSCTETKIWYMSIHQRSNTMVRHVNKNFDINKLCLIFLTVPTMLLAVLTHSAFFFLFFFFSHAMPISWSDAYALVNWAHCFRFGTETLLIAMLWVSIL